MTFFNSSIFSGLHPNPSAKPGYPAPLRPGRTAPGATLQESLRGPIPSRTGRRIEEPIHRTPTPRAGICRRTHTCPEAGQGARQRCAESGRTRGPPLPGQRMVGRAHGGAGRSTGVCHSGGGRARRSIRATTRGSPRRASAPVLGVPCRFQRTVLTAWKVGASAAISAGSPGPGSVLMGRFFWPRCTAPGGPSAVIPEAIGQPVVGWRPCRPARQPSLPSCLRLLAGWAVVRPPFQPIAEGACPAGGSAETLPGKLSPWVPLGRASALNRRGCMASADEPGLQARIPALLSSHAPQVGAFRAPRRNSYPRRFTFLSSSPGLRAWGAGLMFSHPCRSVVRMPITSARMAWSFSKFASTIRLKT